jgi:GTP-binding protein
MIQFADEAVIEVYSGKGGNGCISFRREKYIPLGGPSGGDGGKGGDVVFCVKRNLRTLANLRFHPVFKAKNGQDGMSWNKYGKEGDDVVIPVPPGTALFDAETGELIHEFLSDDENARFVFLKGGKGGWGNVHFKTSTNQAPRYAHEGKPSQMRKIRVELSIMADAGLVGFPNAGKSSLLTAFTNARPKIAPYPFTTKIPNLGVLHVDSDTDIIIADIPGIIQGASEGHGLGHKFLKHISRTACLIFMVDCSADNYLASYDILCSELSAYSATLAEKPRIILCNKIDIDGCRERAREISDFVHKKDPGIPVLPVSVIQKIGLKDAQKEIVSLVNKLADHEVPPADVKTDSSDFMIADSVDEDMPVQFPGSEK